MTTTTKNEKKEAVKFDFRTIKTFEDACAHLDIDPTTVPDLSMIPEEFRKPLIAAYKLMIIYKAINNGWVPDWNDDDQQKHFPWFGVLSSGSGFSVSTSHYDCTVTDVGSRLCTDSSEKARYIAEQFEAEYVDYFLYSE
jgi:hypothetical protein